MLHEALCQKALYAAQGELHLENLDLHRANRPLHVDHVDCHKYTFYLGKFNDLCKYTINKDKTFIYK